MNGTVSWQTVGVLVAIGAAFSCVVIVAFKAFAAAVAQGVQNIDSAAQARDSSLGNRLGELDARMTAQGRSLEARIAEQDRGLMNLRAELPRDYVTRANFAEFRDEWIISTGVLDRKMDRLIEAVSEMRGEWHARG